MKIYRAILWAGNFAAELIFASNKSEAYQIAKNEYSWELLEVVEICNI